MYSNDEKTRMTPFTLGFMIVQFIITVLLIVGFQAVLTSDRVTLGVAVSGLGQEIVGLPDSSKESIEYYIYQSVAKNSTEIGIQESGVNIREGSLINTYYDDLDVHYVNFIADIPEAQQSYQVFHVWSNDSDNEYISPNFSTGVICLKKSQLIYGDFDCDSENDYLRNAIVYSMIYNLGYMSPSINDGIVMIPGPYASSPEFKVEIYYRECESMCICKEVSDKEREEALKKFSGLIESLGFSADDVPHYYNNCENGM